MYVYGIFGGWPSDNERRWRRFVFNVFRLFAVNYSNSRSTHHTNTSCSITRDACKMYFNRIRVDAFGVP